MCVYIQFCMNMDIMSTGYRECVNRIKICHVKLNSVVICIAYLQFNSIDEILRSSNTSLDVEVSLSSFGSLEIASTERSV